MLSDMKLEGGLRGDSTAETFGLALNKDFLSFNLCNPMLFKYLIRITLYLWLMVDMIASIGLPKSLWTNLQASRAL